jgi:modification methylase
VTPAPAARVSLIDLPVNVWFVGQESVGRQRQGRYLQSAVHGHPGKMLPALARRLVATYSRAGDWLLDPMSGIGTTGVEAVQQGRHYVGLELEPRFVAWQRQNLKLARTQGAPGRFAVFQGDARRLDDTFPGGGTRRVLVPQSGAPPPIDTVLFSPPYGHRLNLAHGERPSPFVQARLAERPRWSGFVPPAYGRGADNVGNLTDEPYWTAMRAIYRGCYQVLRPGGLLVLVLQPNRCHALLQPLHHETARLCQELGFQLLDEIVAVLGRVVAPDGEAARVILHASFWRRLTTARQRQAGWPVTLNQLEYVLVFRKPERERPADNPTKTAFRPPLPARDRATKLITTAIG